MAIMRIVKNNNFSIVSNSITGEIFTAEEIEASMK